MEERDLKVNKQLHQETKYQLLYRMVSRVKLQVLHNLEYQMDPDLFDLDQ